MKPYIISTDSMADLPYDFTEEHNIPMIPMYFQLGDKTYDSNSRELSGKDFFDAMRNGEMPTTMASNPGVIRDHFEHLLEQGYDILHIAFSSGLSSSCDYAFKAAEQIMEEKPDARIIVIDSLAATLGQGLLVYYACKKKEEGADIDELAAYIEDMKYHICHMFTVDDLFHLYRGGRVSKASAIIGTIANIKPVLHVDNEGHLINIDKIRGRKRALNALVDGMAERIGDYENPLICITHGDCLEDAEYVKSLIEERFDLHNFMIDYVGCTIGAHTGPGLVALFFTGDHR